MIRAEASRSRQLLHGTRGLVEVDQLVVQAQALMAHFLLLHGGSQ